MLLAGASSVFAYFDGYGQDAYCNVDADGCFVHDDDGNIIYIMFWSEASRMKIMGDLTAPWTDVVTFPVTGNGRLPLMPEISHKTTAADKCPDPFQDVVCSSILKSCGCSEYSDEDGNACQDGTRCIDPVDQCAGPFASCQEVPAECGCSNYSDYCDEESSGTW